MKQIFCALILILSGFFLEAYAAIYDGGGFCDGYIRGFEREVEKPEPKEVFYDRARDFALKYGHRYAEYVLSHRAVEGKTNIVVALNGAENLGKFLALYLEKYSISGVNLIPLYINRQVTGLHRGKIRESDLNIFRGISYWVRSKASELFRRDLEEKIYVEYGYGPDFKPRTRPSNTYGGTPGNSFSELQEYLSQHDVTDADKVLILDTGFLGTIPHAIAVLLKSMGYQNPIEGVMFYKQKERIVLNPEKVTQVYGFNDVVHPEEVDDLYMWMYLFEDGIPVKPSYWSFSNDEYIREGIVYHGGREAFLPSRPSPSKLVKSNDGLWVPENDSKMIRTRDGDWERKDAPFWGRKFDKYRKQTEQGFKDGLSEAGKNSK